MKIFRRTASTRFEPRIGIKDGERCCRLWSPLPDDGCGSAHSPYPAHVHVGRLRMDKRLYVKQSIRTNSQPMLRLGGLRR
jgi:hypothetical protein